MVFINSVLTSFQKMASHFLLHAHLYKKVYEKRDLSLTGPHTLRVGVYSSLSFSLVMAPKCGVRAGAQRWGGGLTHRKTTGENFFNKRPGMREIHFTRR